MFFMFTLFVILPVVGVGLRFYCYCLWSRKVYAFCDTVCGRGTLSLTSPRKGTKRKATVPLLSASTRGLRLPRATDSIIKSCSPE